MKGQVVILDKTGTTYTFYCGEITKKYKRKKSRNTKKRNKKKEQKEKKEKKLSCPPSGDKQEVWQTCTCVSSICGKHTTLSTESCSGRYSHALAYHTNMPTFIRNFHQGMRAGVRTDDGERSEWFNVTITRPGNPRPTARQRSSRPEV